MTRLLCCAAGGDGAPGQVHRVLRPTGRLVQHRLSGVDRLYLQRVPQAERQRGAEPARRHANGSRLRRRRLRSLRQRHHDGPFHWTGRQRIPPRPGPSLSSRPETMAPVLLKKTRWYVA